MARSTSARLVLVALTLVVSVAATLDGRAPTARERYETAQKREAEARAAVERVAPTAPTDDVDRVVRPARRVMAAYEGVVRRFPTSGYSDNALLQAASLSQFLYGRFGRPADRVAAQKYFDWLVREYPGSPLRQQARVAARTLDAIVPASDKAPPSPRTAAAPARPATWRPPAAERPPVVTVPSPRRCPRGHGREHQHAARGGHAARHRTRRARHHRAHHARARSRDAVLARSARWPAARVRRPVRGHDRRTAAGCRHPLRRRRRPPGARGAPHGGGAGGAGSGRRHAGQRLHALQPVPRRHRCRTTGGRAAAAHPERRRACGGSAVRAGGPIAMPAILPAAPVVAAPSAPVVPVTVDAGPDVRLVG